MVLVAFLVSATGCTADPSTSSTPPVSSIAETSPTTSVGSVADEVPPAPSTVVSVADAKLDPASTAQALADPVLAEEGVWSVLANLGIGVYAFSGEQILAGSGTGPDDFWLNEFQVPLLAEMAGQEPLPFSAYLEFIAQFGFEVTESELSADYQAVYEANRDEWLPQLLSAMGVDFTEPPPLTPFLLWLLFVDTVVPPNGEAPTTALRGVNLLAPMSATGVLVGADEPCLFGKDTFGESLWGLAYKGAKYAKGIADAVKEYGGTVGAARAAMAAPDWANAVVMQTLIELDVEVGVNQVHELHSDGQWLSTPDEVDILATASFVADIPDDARCVIKALTGVDLKASGTKDLEGMQVRWTYSPVFGEHGTFRVTNDSETSHTVNHLDATGQQWILYVSPGENADRSKKKEATGFDRFEPAASLMPFSETGIIEATFLVNMADIFNMFADAASIMFPRVETALVVVEWHEPWMQMVQVEDITEFWSGANVTELRTCDGTHWEGSMELDATAEVEGGSLQMTSTTPISFDMPSGADATTVPLTVSTKMAGTVGDATVSNNITMEGSLGVTFDFRAGTADLTLNSLGGSQLARVTAPGGSASGSGSVETSSNTSTVQIELAEDCGD